MKRFLCTASLMGVLLASLTIGAVAQTAFLPPAPQTAASPPDMSPMHFLMGTWNCTTPGAPASTMTFSMAMNNMWMSGHSETSGSSGEQQSTSFDMTYDARNQDWVLNTVNSEGQWGFFFSPGWQGNTMEFKSAGGTDEKSTTLTKMSANQLKIGNSMCKKAG
jgi:hypothetical protein